MPKGELPGDIPEDIAQTTEGPTSLEATPARSQVDPYRAYRELERWLYHGVNMDNVPRSDQRATSDMFERAYQPPGMPADWEDRAEVLGTFYDTWVRDDDGKVIDIQRRYVPVGESAEDDNTPSTKE